MLPDNLGLLANSKNMISIRKLSIATTKESESMTKEAGRLSRRTET
jgi:hypothetical protein